MVTLRNKKIAKVKNLQTESSGQKIVPLLKRPRGRPRKHPIVNPPVSYSSTIQQNDKNENENYEFTLNFQMENDEVCENNNSKANAQRSQNSTVDCAEANYSENKEVSWESDFDHIRLREAIGQQFLEYCHLISQLENEIRTIAVANKLKCHHEKLLMILSKAGIH